jgi:hypothetical protein
MAILNMAVSLSGIPLLDDDEKVDQMVSCARRAMERPSQSHDDPSRIVFRAQGWSAAGQLPIGAWVNPFSQGVKVFHKDFSFSTIRIVTRTRIVLT